MNTLTVGIPSGTPLTNNSATRAQSGAAVELGKVSGASAVGSEPPPSVEASGPATDIGKLRDLVSKANAVIDAVGSGLRFRVDDDTGEVVVKVVDQTSGDVIRQIPSEDMLALKQRLAKLDSASNGQAGLIVTGKA